MKLRDDQLIFPIGHKADGDFGTIGVMPPTEEFVPGDIVHYYDRPDCVGIIAARFPQEVEYDGLSAWTPENILEARCRGATVRGKITIDFYTVVWNAGTVRTAGAHQLHQLRRA